MSNAEALAAAQADPGFHADLLAAGQDPAFREAVGRIDAHALSAHYGNFAEHMRRHNVVHRQEVRLWTLKMHGGSIPPGVESQFHDSLPGAIDDFNASFTALNQTFDVLDAAGMTPLIERHSDTFTSKYAFRPATAFGQSAVTHARGLGFTDGMIADFQGQFHASNYHLIAAAGNGSLATVRQRAQQGAAARVSILQHTYDHGFDYIRGGGPPAWAVTLTEILAAFGICIDVWVLAVVGLVAIAWLSWECAIGAADPVLCAILGVLGFL